MKDIELAGISPILVPLKDKYSVESGNGIIKINIKESTTPTEVELILEEIPKTSNEVILDCKSPLEKVPYTFTLFKHLKKLHVHANPLRSLAGVKYLRALEEINFCNNKEITSIQPLIDCLHLNKIYGAGNNIKEIPDEIKNLPHLTTIHLGSNKIKSFKALTNCTNLTHIYLQKNKIRSIPKNIVKNSMLLSLNLAYNRIEEIDTLSPLILQLNNIALDQNPFNLEKCGPVLELLMQKDMLLNKIADKSRCPTIIECCENSHRNGRHIVEAIEQSMLRDQGAANLIRFVLRRVQTAEVENNNNNNN
jgi:Leucine-rich repeat (LRR) protein